MTIFAVLCRSKAVSDVLRATIVQDFKHKHFYFATNSWFVSSNDTAHQLSEKLALKKNKLTGVVIIATTGAYYGIASPELWDWLKSTIEKSSDE